MSTLSKINLNGTQYDIKEKLSSEYTSYNIAYEPLPGDYVETAISKLHKVILDNEYVTVSALTELNNKAVNTIYMNISEDDTTGEISHSSWGYNSTNEIFKSDTQYKLLKVNVDNETKFLNLIGYYYTGNNNNLVLIYGECFAYTDDESFTFNIIEVSENTTDEGDPLNFNGKTFDVPSDSAFYSLYDAVGKNLSTYLQNGQNIIVDNFNRSQLSLNGIHNSDVIKYNNRTYHYIYETEIDKTFISFDLDLCKFYSISIRNNSNSLAYIYDEFVSDPIQKAITSTNKLSADLIEDGETNKVVSSADIANWNSKTSNVGTITGITMNGVSKGTAGVVDLGTVITSHQDISGKQDVITDLETIRSNAALGATALQNYNETDPVFVQSVAYNITSTDIGNWNSKTSNVGTITGITMNGANKGTSGVVDLGTVITDISGKVDKESGKGLSTNDYTSEEKTKLASINIGDLSNLTTTELNTIFS